MTEKTSGETPSAAPAGFAHRRAALLLPVVLFTVLSLPYAFTKLNGDETHFVTIPYLMVGGDYTLTALKQGEYVKAGEIAAVSYGLAWRYFVRPSDANETTAASLSQYEVTTGAAGRAKPFVFEPDYFVTHRKGGRPLLSFIVNLPALAVTYLLPNSLLHYQKEYIYHPAFLAPRLSFWLLGLLGLYLVFRIVAARLGREAGLLAATAYAVIPITAIWTPDLHQDVPMTVCLIPYFYFLWKQRYVWAGVFWGLAFASKNQAIFALAPIVAEGIWLALDGKNWAARLKPLGESLRALGIVFLVGLAASTPFGYPIGNLVEVWDSSSADIPQLYGVMGLYYRMPLWLGAGMLLLVAAKIVQDARDRFDRLHAYMLIVPVFLFFMHDYRSYMFVPSAAILIGSYFQRKTAVLLLAILLAINLVGLQSPFLTSRRLMYDWLNDPGAPRTIEEIDRYPGLGGVADKPATPAPPESASPPTPQPEPQPKQ